MGGWGETVAQEVKGVLALPAEIKVKAGPAAAFQERVRFRRETLALREGLTTMGRLTTA
jgi:hypothetical protein